MQIVIDIPEEMWEWLHNGFLDEDDGKHAINAIIKGTPLPKEHGDLVDRNAINDRFYSILAELEALPNKPTHKEVLNKLSMCLDTAEPIIKHNYEEGGE